jgi:hypothetical protein
MHFGGRQQAKARMMVLGVVPREEDEGSSSPSGEGAEATADAEVDLLRSAPLAFEN